MQISLDRHRPRQARLPDPRGGPGRQRRCAAAAAPAQVLAFFAKLPPCLVGMEACGTSHHWAREIGTLGHEVRLMPPQYVKIP